MRFFFTCSALFVLLLVLHTGYRYQQELLHNDAKRYLNHQILLFSKTLEEEKSLALSMSVLLSQNPLVVECIRTKNREGCLSIVNDTLRSLAPLTHYTIRIHMHTADFKSLLRAWNLERSGDSLESFRHSLLQAKETKMPLSGIETGREGLFLRGVSPIFDEEEYIGSIEVIFDYKHITNFLFHQGVDFYVLLDKKLSALSNTFGPHQTELLENHIIVNKEANFNKAYLLNTLDLTRPTIMQQENYFFASLPIRDISGKEVGYYVLGVNTQRQAQWGKVAQRF